MTNIYTEEVWDGITCFVKVASEFLEVSEEKALQIIKIFHEKTRTYEGLVEHLVDNFTHNPDRQDDLTIAAQMLPGLEPPERPE